MRLNDWLRQRCREGYTVTKMAQELDCSRVRAYALLRGRASLTDEIVQSVERVTGGSVTRADLVADVARREQAAKAEAARQHRARRAANKI